MIYCGHGVDGGKKIKFIILEPTGNQKPRVVVETDSRKHVMVGEDLTLSCLANGFPVPIYRWYKENGDILKPLARDPRLSVPIAGLLKIEKIRLDDDGKYVCILNNSAGEETVRHSVFVSGKNYIITISQ